VPEQLFPALVYIGVAVTVALTATLLLLMAVKLGTVFVPLSDKPIVVLLLLQL
jgi:hypothetical protein